MSTQTDATGASVREPAASDPPPRKKPSQRWAFVAVLVVAVVLGACVWAWRFESWRPFLATAGAATAAFAGPLPGLLSPEIRGKWLFAVAIATLITAGVWFATKDLEESLKHAAVRSAELEGAVSQREGVIKQRESDIAAASIRLAGERKMFGALMRQQEPKTRDAFLMSSGRQLRALYGNREYLEAEGLAATIIEIDPANGHGLYYGAEVYRHNKDLPNMRDLFQKFLAASEAFPTALTGSANDCYDRPHGYCLERIAYVNHLMALEYLRAAAEAGGKEKVEPLLAAMRFGMRDLTIRPDGFRGEDQFISSCEVLRVIARDLAAQGQSTERLNTFVASLPSCTA